MINLVHQGNRGFSLRMTPKTSRDRRIRWGHLSTIPVTMSTFYGLEALLRPRPDRDLSGHLHVVF